MFEVDTLSPDLNRAAPLAFSVDFYSGDGFSACSAHSSIGVPIAEPVNGTQPKVNLYTSMKDYRAKGPFYTFLGGPVDSLNDFVNGWCAIFAPRFRKMDVTRMLITIIYQEGPYELNLHSVRGVPRRDGAPQDYCESCTAPLPEQPLSSFGVEADSTFVSSAAGAAAFLQRALARSDDLIAKGQPYSFSGAGTLEMTSLALSIVSQAARQVAATQGLPCETQAALLDAANTADSERASNEFVELWIANVPSQQDGVEIYNTLKDEVEAAIEELLAL